MYDYLVVGAGLFGSIVAHELYKAGKSVRVIDERDHVGGNCYTEKMKGITIHKYGPHIFHTDDQRAWDYVNQFISFKPFVNRPKMIVYNDKFYSFPINLMTMNQVWGVKTPDEARKKLKEVSCQRKTVTNFEDWLVSKIGYELYDMFYKTYTEKLWGVSPKELPADFAKRIPFRFNFNDNYYNDDKYQGVPQNGYTGLFDQLLEGIRVDLNTSYQGQRGGLVVYTGRIDEYYKYKFGELNYRGIRFVENTYTTQDRQGNPVINYPEKKYPFLRTTEHKHFLKEKSPVTVVTKEYPDQNGIRCYPVRNEENLIRLAKYQELAAKDEGVVFGGRLGSFEYLSMDEIILRALKCTRENVYF